MISLNNRVAIDILFYIDNMLIKAYRPKDLNT